MARWGRDGVGVDKNKGYHLTNGTCASLCVAALAQQLATGGEGMPDPPAIALISMTRGGRDVPRLCYRWHGGCDGVGVDKDKGDHLTNGTCASLCVAALAQQLATGGEGLPDSARSGAVYQMFDHPRAQVPAVK